MRTTRVMTTLLVGTLLTYHGALAQQGNVYDRLPGTPDVRARYVIYLHGRIIEDQGRRPTHPSWGTYEYQQILDRLAAGGLIVISEQRPPMTDMDIFASHVADQVRALLRAGVPPEHVSVVGFSKGGGIAMRTSALVQNPGSISCCLPPAVMETSADPISRSGDESSPCMKRQTRLDVHVRRCSPSPGRPASGRRYASTWENIMVRSSGLTTNGSHLYSDGFVTRVDRSSRRRSVTARLGLYEVTCTRSEVH